MGIKSLRSVIELNFRLINVYCILTGAFYLRGRGAEAPLKENRLERRKIIIVYGVTKDELKAE